MFHRLTQTEQYWVRDFVVTADDVDSINNLLLEEERPLPLSDLATAIMRHRVQQEENKLARLLARGEVYQPAASHQMGDTLVFPALNFSAATVTGTRLGHNPEYGEFSIIKVEFERTGRTREFASGLSHPHVLNDQMQTLIERDPTLQSLDELYSLYGSRVEAALSDALEQQTTLVELFGLWFLKALVPEIGPGYLNIAEAILDISGGGPLTAAVLLRDMGLPQEAPSELLEYSLNYALFHDDRFDEVGPAGQVLWYLRRLEPPDVLSPPRRLVYRPVEYDHHLLNMNLRRLEAELDDEWSSAWRPSKEPGQVSFTLTYPHRRQGTIPLSSHIAPLFPTAYQAPRIYCTFVDKHSGEEIKAWVVWDGRFVYGLWEWYEKNELPIGAQLHVAPGSEPGMAEIEFDTRRPQSEWVRVARVDDNRLQFGMQKRTVGCQYDDMMFIGMDDFSSADAVWQTAHTQKWSLVQIMVRLFPELARLSPQNTCHAKTLYSAVNIVRRCPPAPIFAELVRQPCFVSMGDNYWRYNSDLWTGE